MQLSRGPVGKFLIDRPVHIYGAGISGLLMGFFLKKAGYQVSIFETQSRVGGKIQTISTELGLVETAANAIYTNDDVYELIQELNLNYISASKGLKKKVWRNNLAKSPPFYFKELFKILFNLFKKTPEKCDQLSVKDFFTPLTGQKFCNEVISSALGGIYAEDASLLHFGSIFKLPLKQQRYFSYFKWLIQSKRGKTRSESISFEGGMQSFINALENKLKDCIHFNVVQELNLNVNNIICTDAHDAAKLLNELAPPVCTELEKIKYNHLNTTTFICDQEISYLKNSFGVLFPQFLDQNSIGILNNSAIFKERTKDTNQFSYTVISKIKSSKNQSIFDEFLTLSKLESSNILLSKTSEWQKAIPIYDKNRNDIMMSIRTKMLDYPDGLILFGNYVDGISIRELITFAKSFSQTNAKNHKAETSSSIQNTSTSPV